MLHVISLLLGLDSTTRKLLTEAIDAVDVGDVKVAVRRVREAAERRRLYRKGRDYLDGDQAKGSQRKGQEE